MARVLLTRVSTRTAAAVEYSASDVSNLNTRLWRRRLNLKAKFEGGSPDYGFKRVAPGAFNLDSICSTCTALPGVAQSSPA
jgi:hypothetical protein